MILLSASVGGVCWCFLLVVYYLDTMMLLMCGSRSLVVFLTHSSSPRIHDNNSKTVVSVLTN